MRKIYVLFISVFVLLSAKTYAQTTTIDTTQNKNYKPILPLYRDVVGDSTVIGKPGKDQQKDFEQGAYMYPPKPKSKWEAGISLGGLFISGDVNSRGGYFGGLFVRKSLGYVVSIKGAAMYGQTMGLNYQGNSGIANNTVLSSRAKTKNATDYFHDTSATGGFFFYNYKAEILDVTAEMLFTLNNIGYHKAGKDRKFNIYAGLGGGGMMFVTKYDALDASGKRYPFKTIYYKPDLDTHKEVLAELKKTLDGKYETLAEGQKEGATILSKSTFVPVFNISMGVGFHLSHRLNLTIMERATFTNNDLLDGDRWEEHPYSDPSLTGNFDTYHNVSASLGIFIGGRKRVEPLYWQNPNDYTYDVLQTLIKKNVDDLVDTDDDGVLDKLDREANTEPGAVVDTHGVTQDEDKDGIPDFKDKDPFSPLGAAVDADGIPVDTDKDGVPDFKDKEANTPGTALVDVNGRTIAPGGAGSGAGGGGYWFLPTIFYDLDKDVVKPEMYHQLKYIAQVMTMYPDLKIVATGNTDIRASNSYNEDLSKRRVNNAKDYLTKTYGISGDRIVVKWAGEVEPIVKGLPDSYNAKYEGQQYYNRRVEFKVYDPKTDK